jgi:hypothetical protein
MKINQYNLKGEFIKSWDSIKDIELELNPESPGQIFPVFFRKGIHDCLSKDKRNTSSYGYIWKYGEYMEAKVNPFW